MVINKYYFGGRCLSSNCFYSLLALKSLEELFKLSGHHFFTYHIKRYSCHICTLKLWWVLNGRIQSFCNRNWHHSTSCTNPSNHSPKPVDFTPWRSPQSIQFSLSISCLQYFNHMGHLILPILPLSCWVHTSQSIHVWENSSMALQSLHGSVSLLTKGTKPFVMSPVLCLASLLAPLPLLSGLQQCLISKTPQT